MLNDFHLAAIINANDEWKLQRIRLEQPSQRALADEWWGQYEIFMQHKEIKFEPGYKLDLKECFVLYDCDFELPPWLEGQNSANIRTIRESYHDENLASSITGIVAFAQDDENNDLILFQNFIQSQVLQPERVIARSVNADSFRSMEGKALGLGSKLTAVYSYRDNKLLFDSFHYAKTFLPSLLDVFDAASEEDIRELIRHNLFICEDEQQIVDNTNNIHLRAKFAMIKDSEILDFTSVEEIQEQAPDYVKIRVQHGKIVFPTDKDEIQTLVKFLNEEFYEGAITRNPYYANSRRLYRP